MRGSQKNLKMEDDSEEKFERSGFLIVRASAGSGKTYRLVRDYLACCLWENQPHYFRHILAITFTNKGAQEMKDRILEYVRSVADGTGSMHKSLMEIMPISAEVLESRARALSESMMHHYQDFSVMTIDKFVSRLVRGFAKDLKWEEDFQLELDETALIDEAVSRLLSRVRRPGRGIPDEPARRVCSPTGSRGEKREYSHPIDFFWKAGDQGKHAESIGCFGPRGMESGCPRRISKSAIRFPKGAEEGARCAGQGGHQTNRGVGIGGR